MLGMDHQGRWPTRVAYGGGATKAPTMLLATNCDGFTIGMNVMPDQLASLHWREHNQHFV